MSHTVTNIALTRAVIPKREMQFLGMTTLASYIGNATAYKTKDDEGNEHRGARHRGGPGLPCDPNDQVAQPAYWAGPSGSAMLMVASEGADPPTRSIPREGPARGPLDTGDRV